VSKMDRSLSSDRLRGIQAIAEYIGEDERRAYYLAASGQLPGVFKQGKLWLGLKSVIREGYERAARGGGVIDAAP
jgi:hypothetical protein